MKNNIKEYHSSDIEVGVNKVLAAMIDYKDDAIFALAILHEASVFISKKTGTTLNGISVTPDKIKTEEIN